MNNNGMMGAQTRRIQLGHCGPKVVLQPWHGSAQEARRGYDPVVWHCAGSERRLASAIRFVSGSCKAVSKRMPSETPYRSSLCYEQSEKSNYIDEVEIGKGKSWTPRNYLFSAVARHSPLLRQRGHAHFGIPDAGPWKSHPAPTSVPPRTIRLVHAPCGTQVSEAVSASLATTLAHATHMAKGLHKRLDGCRVGRKSEAKPRSNFCVRQEDRFGVPS